MSGPPDFLPFTRPSIDEDTIAGVAEVLRSGWITSGPQVRAFEAALSAHCGGRPVRALSSATGALEIALTLAGVGPAELKIETLLRRLDGEEVEEVIVATSPNVEGDATALYLSKLLRPLGMKVSRIASGVAVGGELEYADMSTLHRALADRRVL